ELAQKCDVVQDPDRPPMCANYQVIIGYHDVPNRCLRQIQREGLPVVTIIRREVNRPFSCCVEQPFANWIFTNRVHSLVIRDPVNDSLPALAAIMCAIDARMKIVY